MLDAEDAQAITLFAQCPYMDVESNTLGKVTRETRSALPRPLPHVGNVHQTRRS
jgi:hypothetical protein